MHSISFSSSMTTLKSGSVKCGSCNRVAFTSQAFSSDAGFVRASHISDAAPGL